MSPLSFHTKFQLSTHIHSVHISKHICHTCAATFKSRSQLSMHHQRVHSGETKQKVQCSQCAAWLADERSLRKHQDRHDQVQVACKLCNKMTPNRYALSSHMRYVHSSHSFACQMCGKTFRRAIGLRVRAGQSNCESAGVPQQLNRTILIHTRNTLPRTPASICTRARTVRARLSPIRTCSRTARKPITPSGIAIVSFAINRRQPTKQHMLVHRKKKNIPPSGIAIDNRIQHIVIVIIILHSIYIYHGASNQQ